ncbi:hypothetical protein [Candidatus Agathobaculum pullicola]|uniref:hypothetical protein n=1 Tax=Candidatus Agathobaculum pullicola TaxID=2838426 RepID=UPI003F901894
MPKTKKIRKHKQAKIILEPDGFSIHTFELSMKLSKSEWKQIKHALYNERQGEGGNWIYQDKQSGHYICTRYTDAGIRIRLEHNDTGKGESTHFIRMIVNPRKLIYPQSEYLGILPPDEDSIELLEKAFQHLFRHTPFDNNIHRYYLSRVDLCTNIRCSNKKVFRELVRLLRKTATPKKYERKFYQHQDKKKANRYNKHYIRIACGSQELVIYDKTYQMDENGLAVAYENLPDSVLRIEVHYSRGKLKSIEDDARTDDPLDVLWLLIRESKPRIIKLVEKCYPDVPYLSYDEAQEQIRQSCFQSATRERMLFLLNQMQRKQTVDAAFAQMEKQGLATKGLLSKFEKLGFSPIPLRKGYAAARMPSLTEILRSIDKQPATIDLYEWKWK